MYAEGDGVPQDDKEALRWFRLAAAQGNAMAQNSLGLTYERGQGVPKDYQKALRWYRLAQGQAYEEAILSYRRAANQGDATAQYNLGEMYMLGRGVPKDYTQAYVWVALAAAQDDKKAAGLRDYLESVMTPAQIAEAQRLVREWKPKQ